MKSILCALLVFLLLGVAVDAQVITTAVVRAVPHGSNYSSGLAWDALNEQLYVASSSSTAIEVHDPYTSTKLRTITAPNSKVRGLAFDPVKNQLWMASWYSPPTPSVFVLNPLTGAVITSYTSPFTGGKSNGLTWDGATVWLGQEGGHLHKMDVANWPKNTQVSIPSAGSYEPRDIAWDTKSNCLWVCYQSPPLLKKHNPTTGAVLGQFSGPNTNQQGCAWDGWHLWVTGSATPQQMFQIDVTAPYFLMNGALKGGTNINFQVTGLPTSEKDNVLIVGMSASGTNPPIVIGGKRIPLLVDNFTLLGLTVLAGSFSGTVDANGAAQTKPYQIPVGIPSGFTLWFAGATFGTGGIASVTEPLKFVVK